MDESIPGFDLYATLKVARDAPVEVIVAAHRALVRREHPDLRPGPAATSETKRLNIARDWLIDPARRAAYDLTRNAPVAVDRLDARPRSRAPAPVQRSRYPSGLNLWIARCDRLDRRDLARLARAFQRAVDGRPDYSAAAGEVTRITSDAGRSAAVDQATAAALAACRATGRPADPRLSGWLRWIACAIAIADLKPGVADTVLAPWRAVIDERDADAERHQRGLGAARHTVGRFAGRVVTYAVVAVIAVLVLAGVYAVAATGFGWSGW